MKAGGTHRFPSRGKLISAAIIGVAIALSLYAARMARTHPSSTDASIDADVVHIAAAVGGRIITIAVRENARVAKGDLLFQIDPLPYRLALAQAQADLDLAAALLETQRRFVSTQRSNAIIAADQTKNAAANYALATRTADRLRPLTAQGYVPGQQLDQAEVTAHDAATTLRQTQEHRAAAEQAIDTEKASESAVAARRAALALAQRHLEDTTVTAPHDGLVVGLTVSSGEMAAPAQSLFTLINTDEWLAVGNFRETDLGEIRVGDCATVYSMIDRQVPIKGIVEGIGWGVLDQDRINLPRSVPFVERSLNWVRVAQRFPVRIKLEEPPPQIMRLGASAVVEVRHGLKCR